jgi:hypothetical protein
MESSKDNTAEMNGHKECGSDLRDARLLSARRPRSEHVPAPAPLNFKRASKNKNLRSCKDNTHDSNMSLAVSVRDDACMNVLLDDDWSKLYLMTVHHPEASDHRIPIEFS